MPENLSDNKRYEALIKFSGAFIVILFEIEGHVPQINLGHKGHIIWH